jgi:hypothetical protein
LWIERWPVLFGIREIGGFDTFSRPSFYRVAIESVEGEIEFASIAGFFAAGGIGVALGVADGAEAAMVRVGEFS